MDIYQKFRLERALFSSRLLPPMAADELDSTRRGPSPQCQLANRSIPIRGRRDHMEVLLLLLLYYNQAGPAIKNHYHSRTEGAVIGTYRAGISGSRVPGETRPPGLARGHSKSYYRPETPETKPMKTMRLDSGHSWSVSWTVDTFTRVSLLGLPGSSKHLLLRPSIRCVRLETTWLTAAEESRCGESWREVLLVLT